MTTIGWIQILLFSIIIFAVTKPIGVYMFRIFEESRQPLPRFFGPIERLIYRLCGVDPKEQQDWQQYALAMLLFSAITLLVTYAIERLQHVLPFNPQNLGPVPADLAFGTASSFTTNTNWQAYGGESTMSYLTQMAGLAWHNFISVGVGIGVMLAIARGLTYRLQPSAPKTIGNFWVDLNRSVIYLLIPFSIVTALVLVWQGVLQNFSSSIELTTLEGAKQTLAMGPTASQIAIKQLGTNGGGFFNANSAHPFEGGTPLANFIEMVAILAIPAAQTYMYGLMARDTRQGWTLFGAMAILFFMGVTTAYYFEAKPNPVMQGLAVDQVAGNMEGKEVRYGVANSVTWATATTAASNGSVNSMHDSYNAIAGMVPLVNIQLGEVVFGGVGAGLYGMLVFVLLSVFIAGLMVGRTPEYLGKKVEAREMKLVMLYVLIFPLLILVFTAWSAVVPYGLSSLNNNGPHGLSEILYAYSSAAGNNGSAFAGLNANTPWYNITQGLTMLAGRFLMIIPVLAIAGCMVGKKAVPESLGTFPTNRALFVVLLVGVVLIVGALTFFPALSLGPIVEHFVALAGKVY
ncbi:MAG TPA: potassium-transporting ATPase subunit KdpA [Candidatus Binatia bacterium]|nr:potassium-transporting ATPase subunit KdpA [Candidatus Binatia bacterium]